MKQESSVLKETMLALGSGDGRVFRNNVALAWSGEHAQRFHGEGTVRVHAGDVLLRNARPLHAGLCKGSSDLIGWHSIVVTAAMVGKRIAIFESVETKSERGRATPEQRQWLQVVADAGGIAILAKSAEYALKQRDNVIASLNTQEG